MILSMTGFGAATIENDDMAISVDIKTLNSKGMDSNIKMSSVLASKEIDIKNLVATRLERGKANISVNVTAKNASLNKVSLNKELISSYYKDLKEVAQELGDNTQDIFRLAVMMPESTSKSVDEENIESAWSLLKVAVLEASDKCTEFRRSEGEALAIKLEEYVASIGSNLEQVASLDPERIVRIKERISSQIAEYENNENFDPNRFEQELIYYIEKLDINEEKVRLAKHLDYFTETMNSKKSNGKKLGFIAQEIGREINTIGSKANDAAIQRLVVNMKEELEKIKEQVLNVV